MERITAYSLRQRTTQLIQSKSCCAFSQTNMHNIAALKPSRRAISGESSAAVGRPEPHSSAEVCRISSGQSCDSFLDLSQIFLNGLQVRVLTTYRMRKIAA